MELLDSIPFIGPALGIALPFLLVLSIVVFIHEFGHYIVGRWSGIHAEVFSIGFGKPVWQWHDKRGTRWQVAWIPLGGFVRFVGDMDPASAGRGRDDELSPEDRARAFHNASLWARTLTVSAGPVFNFVLSIVIFAALALALGKGSEEPVVGAIDADAAETIGLAVGDKVIEINGVETPHWADVIAELYKNSGETVPALVEREGGVTGIEITYVAVAEVSMVTPGMPASAAGILPGDIVTAVNGMPIRSFRDLQLAVAAIPLGEDAVIEVQREGETLSLTVTPEIVEREDPRTGEVGPVPTVGIMTTSRGGLAALSVPVTAAEAAEIGVSQTWGVISGTVNYLGDMIFANADPGQLGGPIRIAQVSSERAQQGLVSLFHLIAVLSTSIGLLNLFPIPVLDGGHLLFYIIEALRGRPVGDMAMKVGTAIGLSLVLLLMVFATYNDLLRL